MWIIVKIQSTFRMWLAKKKVQELRNEEYYGPGMHHHDG